MAFPSTHTRVSGLTGSESYMAATPLNVRNQGDREYLDDALAAGRTVSTRAWRHYNRLGVVRYPLNRAARLAGATRLHAAMIDDKGEIAGRITRDDPVSAAIDIVNGIYSRVGGVRGLIERYFLLMKVPADSVLVRVKEGREYDGYMFLSPDEIQTGTGTLPAPAGMSDGSATYEWVTRPGGFGRPSRSRKIARQDILGRVWMPSPHYVDMADPVLETLDADCDTLFRLQTVLRAQLRSRAAMSGFLFLPASLNQLAMGKIKEAGPQNLVDRINDTMSKNLELAETGEAADIAPIVISGEDDAGMKIREILLGGETKETDLRLRQELFERILFSLDINVRSSKGTADTRYQSWNDNSEELRLAVIPDIEAMCWAMTRLILYPELKKQGIPAEQIMRTVVWYDLSEASVKINRQDDANQLADRGGLALRVSRRVGGFDEKDAPSDEEYIRQFGWRQKNPYLAFHKMTLPEDFDWEKAMMKPDGAPADSAAEEPDAGPGQGDPGSPSDTDTDDKPTSS